MHLPENGRTFDVSRIIIPGNSWAAGSVDFRGPEPFYLPKETCYSGGVEISDWVCGPLAVYIPLRLFGYNTDVNSAMDIVKECGGNEVIGTPNWVIERAFRVLGLDVKRLNINSSFQLKSFLEQGWLAILNLWEVNEGSLEGSDRMGDGHIMVALSVDKFGKVLAADPSFRPQDNGIDRAYGLVTLTEEGLRIRHFDFSCGCGVGKRRVDLTCDHDYYPYWVNSRRTILSADAVWERGATILVKPKVLRASLFRRGGL